MNPKVEKIISRLRPVFEAQTKAITEYVPTAEDQREFMESLDNPEVNKLAAKRIATRIAPNHRTAVIREQFNALKELVTLTEAEYLEYTDAMEDLIMMPAMAIGNKLPEFIDPAAFMAKIFSADVDESEFKEESKDQE